MVVSICIPIAIRVPQQFDKVAAIPDMFDSREEVLDVVPIYHTVAVDVVARDVLDVGFSWQAEGLGLIHWRYVIAVWFT